MSVIILTFLPTLKIECIFQLGIKDCEEFCYILKYLFKPVVPVVGPVSEFPLSKNTKCNTAALIQFYI